jgi:hypothetical protein
MEQEIVPAPIRRRLNRQGRAVRRKRIFARLREGWSYDEIAREERLTTERVREIVSEVLEKRIVDDGSTHALLQLERLAPVLQTMGEAAARGDAKAAAVFLRALDRLDRYQKVAQANHAYNDDMREKLFAKINRVAAAALEEQAEKEARAAAAEAASALLAGTPANGAERQGENFAVNSLLSA